MPTFLKRHQVPTLLAAGRGSTSTDPCTTTRTAGGFACGTCPASGAATHTARRRCRSGRATWSSTPPPRTGCTGRSPALPAPVRRLHRQQHRHVRQAPPDGDRRSSSPCTGTYRLMAWEWRRRGAATGWRTRPTASIGRSTVQFGARRRLRDPGDRHGGAGTGRRRVFRLPPPLGPRPVPAPPDRGGHQPRLSALVGAQDHPDS